MSLNFCSIQTLHYLFHRAPLGGRTNSVNVIVEPLPIGLGLNNCIRVDPWSRLSIPEGRKLFLVGDLRLSHPINKQTVTIWVSVNLSSPLSLRKNLVVLALYQYSRPSPLSEADNIANPRGGNICITLGYFEFENYILKSPPNCVLSIYKRDRSTPRHMSHNTLCRGSSLNYKSIARYILDMPHEYRK
ncbi:hypothetical protein J6590_083385 [Homalodisca vitripennis]|nr:hypothetical protein J6590_083385 [Homalodisca vitripennis]